ncbi:MAG TPA: SGNH/GDSL hydrolase family protein [Terracidiphilus sp.]|nr:SGNH/GDSL hydrolase family protein [Terracidiphilus sp.]
MTYPQLNSNSSTRPHGLPPVVRKALASLLALAILLALADAALHFGLGLGNPVLIAPDAACGYIMKPNQRVFRFFVHTYINPYGMRSADFQPVKPPHTYRVLFVGDSITYGTTRIDQSQIFTQLLDRSLPTVMHQPVEVLNASASAWAIDNELSFVRSRGIFQSNVVMLVLNSGDLSQTRAKMPDVNDDLPFHKPASALNELYERLIRPYFLHLHRRFDAGDSTSQVNGQVIRANIAYLDSFRALVESQHARFVIVYAPIRKEIPTISSRSAILLHAWCAAHRVPLLDLTSVEAEYKSSQITLEGVHFNTFGNRVVADAILKDWPRFVLHSAPDAAPAQQPASAARP